MGAGLREGWIIESPETFRALVFMCSLFASAGWCLARPNVLSSTAMAVSSGLWLPLNGQLEGYVLYTLTRGHGITEADLLSLVGVCIAAWGFAVSWRRGRRGWP